MVAARDKVATRQRQKKKEEKKKINFQQARLSHTSLFVTRFLCFSPILSLCFLKKAKKKILCPLQSKPVIKNDG